MSVITLEQAKKYTDKYTDSFSDKHREIFGLEYLSSYQKKIMAGTATKTIFSGDSTTDGGLIDSNFYIWKLFADYNNKNGIYNSTVVNGGHSGMGTDTWLSTYLSEDMLQTPDLYILRWGMNDSLRGVTAFLADLRAGLEIIRGSKPVSSLSIILMTPNTSNDLVYPTRSKAWHESINIGIKQLAREFLCCFIDTYALFKDGINASDFMDDTYGTGDGSHVHPQEIMNIWIVSEIIDILYPTYLMIRYGKTSENVKLVTTEQFQNFWHNFAAGYAPAGYYKDSAGIVHLQGVIAGGTDTSVNIIFTLPVGYRPKNTEMFTAYSSSGFSSVWIEPDGVISFRSGANSFFSLSGISFTTN